MGDPQAVAALRDFLSSGMHVGTPINRETLRSVLTEVDRLTAEAEAAYIRITTLENDWREQRDRAERSEADLAAIRELVGELDGETTVDAVRDMATERDHYSREMGQAGHVTIPALTAELAERSTHLASAIEHRDRVLVELSAVLEALAASRARMEYFVRYWWEQHTPDERDLEMARARLDETDIKLILSALAAARPDEPMTEGGAPS